MHARQLGTYYFNSNTIENSINLLENIKWTEISNISQRKDYPSRRIGHTMTSIGSNYFILYGGRDYLGHCMSPGKCYIFLFLLLLFFITTIMIF